METTKTKKTNLKKLLISSIIILCIIYGGTINTLHAQPQPTFNIKVKNFVLGDTLGGNGNVLLFDIFIQHTNWAASGPFELALNQYYFNFNPAIANGGTLSYRIVPGSSQFTNPLVIPRNPAVVGSRLDLNANVAPGAGNGQIIDTTIPETRVVKMQLATTANTFATVPLNLRLRDTLNGSPYTKIFAYIGTTNTEITNNGTYTIDSTYNTLYANDIAASSINSPPSTINLPTATIAPKASFRNAGTVHQLHIPVTFKITGPVSYTSNKIIASLAPGATIQVSFDSTFNPIAGSYNVSTYSRLTTDSNRVNDTLKTTLNVVTVSITLAPEGFLNTSTNTLNMRDTVRVYLRNNSAPFAIVDSGKTVIDSLTLTGSLVFNNAPSGTYYISVKHRNSIETWSKAGGEQYDAGWPFNYNFTSAQTQAYGNNLVLKGTKYCIYSGDVNQEGIIDISDISRVYNAASNSIFGYVPEDVSGEGFVDVTDVSIVYNNSKNSVTKITPSGTGPQTLINKLYKEGDESK